MSVHSPEVTAVVAGSFGPQNLPFIAATVHELTEAGITVSVPRLSGVRNPDESFIVFDTDDPYSSPRELEATYMDKIAAADTLVVVNHRFIGRVGMSAAAEIAHATLHGVPLVITHHAIITERDYPDIYFSGEVTRAEQAALDHVGYGTLLAWPQPNPMAWRRRKDLASPMPSDHPDYAALSGLRERLLASLPAEAIPNPNANHKPLTRAGTL